MGIFFSSLWSRWFPNKEYKLVMVGLDNAGKTTTLYRLHLGQHITTTPTIGSNVEVVQYKNMSFEVWDLGGQESLRPSWATYYQDADAVVMVVDSADRARISVVKAELVALLGTEAVRQAPILIYANKQDLPDAMDVAELTEALQLHSVRSHDWHIQDCSAVRGTGLMEGLAWLSQRIHLKRRASSFIWPRATDVAT